MVDNVLKMTHLRPLIDRVADPLFKWGQAESLWTLHMGLKCCAIEMMAFGGGRFDAERWGMVFRSSPRQCDLMVVNGPITIKMAPRLKTLYEQMPDPKWVIAMGECAICGGPFWQSFNVMKGCDKVIPVDVYIPGCPPRPEALLYGAIKLQEKIRRRRPPPRREWAERETENLKRQRAGTEIVETGVGRRP